MKKKGNHEGHIRRRTDGRWEAQITISGNKRRSIYGKTRAEASKKMKAVLSALDNGTYQEPSRLTLSEWLQEWLVIFCQTGVKPLTYSSYQGIIAHHIAPVIGNVKLQAIKGTHIQRLYNTMTEAGLSAKTVKNTAAVLHKALNVAIKQGYIQSNPCDAATLPKSTRKEIHPLTDAEIPLFLNAIKGIPFENAYALCLFAGLRRSECLGLSWKQVDFDAMTITINQQLQANHKNASYYISPSTKSSKPRTIKPPAIAFDYLKAERRKQLENHMRNADVWSNANDLVFTNEIGQNFAFSTFYKTFKRVVASIGRPDARPHDLRHTAATVAIASGSDIKSVQDMLGHATASFTLNVYTHTTEKMMQDTADRMQSYYDVLKLKA